MNTFLLCRSAVFLALTILLASCGASVSRQEVVRLPSDDKKVDAVLIEMNGGATTAFGYEVHIVPRGSQPKKGDAVAFLHDASRNQQAYGVNLVWLPSNTLAVQYEIAETAKLYRQAMDVAGEHVVVRLQSGIRDPLAPPGGMEYNLHKELPH